MAAAAADLAAQGWRVLPLHGKLPAVPKRDGGRGVLDATRDPETVGAWWARWPAANIGARVPDRLIVLDVDPRHDGHLELARLEAEHGPLPATFTVLTGSQPPDSRHLYFRRPPGPVLGTFAPGVDVRTSAHYCVMPPSRHPDTRCPYLFADETQPVAELLPGWAIERLRPPVPAPTPFRSSSSNLDGDSIADTYSREASWTEVLVPHGWRCLDPDPDADEARWRHPAATAAWSATIRHGLLFVYSTNTPFPVTGVGDPHGLTRFRAYAILTHGGDMSAAARELRGRHLSVVA